MKDFSDMTHFPESEQLVEVICHKTGTNEPLFFRILVAYYLTKVASMMRCSICTHDRGEIPVNLYAINLASSGMGKNYSANILEEQVLNGFNSNFLDYTFNEESEKSLTHLSSKRAVLKHSDPGEEFKSTMVEFNRLGNYLSEFDSGTSPAFKQLRHKCLMAGIGSLNFIVDELGSNLLSNVEMLNVYLESYDKGLIKQKLIKNTAESVRNEEITGAVPANMLLFGTQLKLFDGAKTEEMIDEFLGIGFARRCHFGLIESDHKVSELTADEIYDLATNPADTTVVQTISDKLAMLADSINFNRVLTMSRDIAILIIEYRKNCELRASMFAEHEEVKKAEMSHRYFKALKLAGTYAFINGDFEITEDILYSAIKLTEESGTAFHKILNRDRPFVKLAKYIVSVNREVTHVDLVEDLPFYKGSEIHKRGLMTLAIAYAYQHNMIIKHTLVDGIEFLKGESLELTDINNVVISYGVGLAKGYKNETVAFTDLHKLTQLNKYNWVAHHVLEGHRREASIMQGFNLIVLDIDDGVDIATVKLLMQKYTYHIYTTKRHTAAKNRFRLVLPMSHTLQLDKEDYTTFMESIYEWLPFGVDDQTKDRCRKWMSHPGNFWYNDGELVDSLMFIPKTAKNDERINVINTQQSFNNLERWLLNQSSAGNRNNTVLKYALMLVDMGRDFMTIQDHVETFNSKLPHPLPEDEIKDTIMRTVNKKLTT